MQVTFIIAISKLWPVQSWALLAGVTGLRHFDAEVPSCYPCRPGSNPAHAHCVALLCTHTGLARLVSCTAPRRHRPAHLCACPERVQACRSLNLCRCSSWPVAQRATDLCRPSRVQACKTVGGRLRPVEPQRLPRTVQTPQTHSSVHSSIVGQKQELSHSCCKM